MEFRKSDGQSEFHPLHLREVIMKNMIRLEFFITLLFGLLLGILMLWVPEASSQNSSMPDNETQLVQALSSSTLKLDCPERRQILISLRDLAQERGHVAPPTIDILANNIDVPYEKPRNTPVQADEI